MRFYRGRLLAELRSLPTGSSAPLWQLTERLTASGVAEPPAGWETVGRHLARDGLARLDDSADTIEVALA